MPLIERVERLLGSKIVFASLVEGAILVPYDSDTLELTIGQDFALGYESHDTKELTLYATESFTFRVLEPKAIVCFKKEQNFEFQISGVKCNSICPLFIVKHNN